MDYDPDSRGFFRSRKYVSLKIPTYFHPMSNRVAAMFWGHQICSCLVMFGPLHPHSKLDDGWPESVEEQGLLLLVWRHHITKQYIKDVLYAVEKSSIKTI